MVKYDNVLETVGNTPHVKINKLFANNKGVTVYSKLEKTNPGGSIKDRIAMSMIETAEMEGKITPGQTTIIEPTSGNTGIGLALVCAVKGYKLILTMPESMSIERRKLMAVYGAELALTPKAGGMKGAIAKAEELAASTPNSWIPMQFENPSNNAVHYQKTAEEIKADFPNGLDYIITGVGTGGHITGVAENLKKSWPNLKVFAVEPEASPVLSGGKPGPHRLMGIGAGFIPGNCHQECLDGVVQVAEAEAFDMARRSAIEEGIFIGISSGASLAAVAKKIDEMAEGSTVLTFNYDTGERYLSVEGLY